MQYNLHKTSYVSLHDPDLSDVKDQCHHLVPAKSQIFLSSPKGIHSLYNSIHKRGAEEDKQF